MSGRHAATTPSTRLRAWVAQIGLLAAALLLLPSWAPSASAATGTVKIDNEIPQNNNNPHQGCGIIVELYDWSPAGPASVYVVFTGQGGAGAGVVAGSTPASGPGNPITFTAGSGGAGAPDGSQLYEVDTTGLVAQAGGQFHIDVDTYDTATGAVIGKQKVIWVETCNSDLEVTKAGPATYVRGGTGSYTIDVTNNGPNRAPGPITVVDTLPAGETATSATGTGWLCDLSVSTKVTCTYAADLARGEDAPRITVGISYGAGATGNLTDTATVDAGRIDLDPSNDSSSVTTRPLPTVDVGLTKTATPAGVAPGATVTYTVTVTNNGTAPVTSFTVSDPLGTGLTPVSASSTSPGLTCVVGPPVSCVFAGSLAGGASATATVVARVGAAFTGQSVTNAASVSMPLDSDPTNNSDSVTTRVVHPVDLAVVKTVTSPAPPAAVAPGDTITYSLAVTNAGNGPVTTFTLSDPVPATHALVSVTENDPRLACTNAVSCTFAGAADALDPGETVTVTVVTTVLSSVTATSVSNTATVPADSNNANNSSTATTAVTQPKDVALAKSHAPAGPFAPGDTVTYTLTATNDGVLPITAFTISDPLATGLTWVSSTGGPGLTCAASAPVSCSYAGTLTSGQSVVATVVATVTSSFTGTSVLNVATATMAGDSDNSNDSDSDVIDITQPKDVALTKTASPLTAKPGDTVTYTLTATNDGVLPVTGFTLSDPLASGLTWVSTTTTSTGLTCATSAPVSCTYAGTLLAGQSVVATVTTTVTSSFTGTSISNVATATMRGDSDSSDNSASALVAVTQPKDVALAKGHAPAGPFAPGDTVTYTLTATNDGVLPITAFTISDPLATGLTWVSTSGGPGLSCVGGTPVSCSYTGSLTTGQSVSATVVATVTSGFTGTSLLNVATATMAGDSDNSNDSDSDVIDVTQPKDVALTKSASPTTVKPGDTVTYALTATNDGVLPVTAFTVTDPLATGLAWVSTTTTSPGLTCASGLPVSCGYAGTLTSGQSVVATVVATVTPGFTGTSILNVATATMAGDSDNSNDSATALVAVTQPKDLALTKTAAPSPVSAGGTVTYTLTATNAGVLPITSFTLSDALGAGLTWVSTATTSPGLTCSAGSPVSCAFAGSLASGQSVVATVVATVPASYAGATVRNAATTTTPGDGNPANDTAAVTTDVVRPDLTIAKSAPVTATSGSTGSYVLTVTNTGTGPAAGPTTVSDPVPAGAVPTAAAGAGWTCTLAAGTVSCSLPGGLAAGAAAAPITVDVTWGAPGTVANTATVAPAPGETDLGDNTATASTTVAPAPTQDLSLVKTGPATAAPGDTLTWTLTVANNGTAPATGVLVTDPLATGLTLVTASGSGWTCSGTTVSCTLDGPLAVGGTAVLTVSAVLDSTFAGAVVANTAVVGPSDATPADNTDTHVTDVEGVAPAPADLVLTKTGPADAVEPGDTITWTIEVTNAGGSPIAGFTVTDPLADGLEVETATGDGFTCDAFPTVSCVHAGALAPGDSVTLVVTSVLPITWEDDTVVNTATVGPADATDDNTDTATTDVVFPITGGGGGPVVTPPAGEPVTGGGGGLATTGAELLRTLGLAGLLVLLGLVLSLAGRRRRTA